MLERDKKGRENKTEIEGLWDEILLLFTSQLLSLSRSDLWYANPLCRGMLNLEQGAGSGTSCTWNMWNKYGLLGGSLLSRISSVTVPFIKPTSIE